MEERRTLKARFILADSKRSGHLERQRKCATLTIPQLLPPEGNTDNDPLPTPWQSVGARACNNLAAKLLLALLPPNSPFFRFSIEPELLRELQEKLDADDLKTQVEDRLAEVERTIQDFIETSAIRVPTFKALLQCIVVGNVCCYVPEDGRMRLHRLDNFVVKRDPAGDMIELIIRERVALKVLPPKVQDYVSQKVQEDELRDGTIELYTLVERDGNKFFVEQEVAGERIHTINHVDRTSYTVADCPWIVLTWSLSTGDNYARSHVDEYLGDFQSLETLAKALVQGNAAAARLLFLVNPAGVTDERDLVDADNGGFVVGRPEDVVPLQVNKMHDFREAAQAAAHIEERLSQAFLLRSSVQRQAERVTAEEIRYMAQELEDALGGIYSMMSQSFQLPIVQIIFGLLKRKKKLPPLPDKSVRPKITTGLEAIGRGHDLNKLMSFIDIVANMGPSAMSYLNVSDFIARAAIGLGLDTDGLVKTQEQVAQEQQEAMAAQMGMQVAPAMAQEGIKAAASQGA